MRACRYRIIISGQLGETGREAFADFRIECHGTNTVLVGDLDQAAVFGTLNRIRALGLELVGLKRLPERMNYGSTPAQRRGRGSHDHLGVNEWQEGL